MVQARSPGAVVLYAAYGCAALIALVLVTALHMPSMGIRFAPKEGLAFINGTQAQTALLAMLVHDAEVLWRSAVGAAAMSLEALRGTPTPFDARIHDNRPHDGQRRTAALLRRLLAESEIRESHRQNDPRVQDAYSLRCTPQVLGAVADAIGFARRVAEVELNA